MKNLLTTLVFTCGILAPTTIHAEPEFVQKYGGFKPGDQFTLRVTGKDVVKAGDVPNEVPSFNRGGTIKFTIGPKGQLTARENVKIEFDDGSTKANEYARENDNPFKLTSLGRIEKNENGKAIAGKLVFKITDFNGPFPFNYRVTYTLKK